MCKRTGCGRVCLDLEVSEGVAEEHLTNVMTAPGPEQWSIK